MTTDVARVTCLSCGQANGVPLARMGAGPKCATCGARLASGDVAAVDVQIHDKATRINDLPPDRRLLGTLVRPLQDDGT